MSISNSVGRLIKKYRKQNNLTIEELARRVNISKTYLSLIENQARNINIKRIDDIAKALGVSTTALLKEEDETLQENGSDEFIEVVPRGASPENRIRIQMVELGEVYIGKRNRKKVIYRKIPLLDPGAGDDPGIFYSGDMPEGLADMEIECPLDIDDLTAFAFRMPDDSMLPRVEKGDLLIACPSWDLKDHHMAIVKVSDEPATCRSCHRVEGKYMLVALNPRFSPQVVSANQVEWLYPVARLIGNMY